MNDNKLEIFTVPEFSGNAYILETIDGHFETLWTAALLKNGAVDDAQFAWGIIEDEEIINSVLDSTERTVISDIRVDDFVNLLESV
jgi:hypothetical protein